MVSPDATLSIYFDGLCQLCSREIEHYRRQKGSEKFNFVDITAADFNPFEEGLDPVKVHQVMHVKNSEGELKTGLEAFITIWDHLPKYQCAARWARKPALRKVLETGYSGFALVRPYLPRKKRDCESSPYCETRRSV